MKIDLHMHTRKILESENEGREIKDANKFKRILKEAQIGVAAITNHNTFDIKQYNSFIDNDNYLLLPGVEYDVNIINEDSIIKRRQLNIIFNPKFVEKFNNLINKNSSSHKHPIKIEKIIKEFDNENTIFYIDYKNSKTKWDVIEFDKYFNSIKGVCIFDVNRIKTHFLLMAHDYKSLIGSDLLNWDKYVSTYSKKLINTSIKFTQYNLFVKVLKGKHDLEIVKANRLEKSLLNVRVNNNKSEKNKDAIIIENIPITNRVNIIFGAKATGKTGLLVGLYDKYSDSKIYYESRLYNETFKNMINNKNIDIFKKSIDEMNEKITEFSSYIEDKFKHFKNFYLSFDNPAQIKLQNTLTKNQSEPKEKNDSYIKIIDTYNKLLIDLKENVSNLIFNKNLSIFKETAQYLKQEYIKNNMQYLSFKIIEKIKLSISNVIQINRGETSTPTKIGLFNTFVLRKKLWKTIDEFKKMKKYYSKNIDEFKIPDGNTWTYKRKLYLIDSNDINDPFNAKGEIKYSSKELSGIKEIYKNGLGKLFELNKWSNPMECIQRIKELINKYKLYCLVNKVENNLDDSEPSNGEKAYISLFSILNKDANAFFLDEPETYLGNKMISDHLVKKIKELSLENKRIIITTHNNSLGINTIPFNFIYRDIDKWDNDTYKTYIGSFNENEKLISLRNDEKISLTQKIIEHFEGDINQFDFRKDIYYENRKY